MRGKGVGFRSSEFNLTQARFQPRGEVVWCARMGGLLVKPEVPDRLDRLVSGQHLVPCHFIGCSDLYQAF